MHNIELLRKLRMWRDETARRKGVETYRILSNAAIGEIAENMPQTRDELLNIKGIKEKKFQQFGREILTMVRETIPRAPETPNTSRPTPSAADTEPDIAASAREKRERRGGGENARAVSVSEYLDLLNKNLFSFGARVRGEISSVHFRDTYLFFGLKDPEDESVVNCFMWMSDYRLSGAEIKEGLEVVAEGVPEVYKPNGRLTFRAHAVELVGEGALKKAYDLLKKKLSEEGVFDSARKKPIPPLVTKVGLITSREGAVIHDFLNNLGRYGFQIRFVHSRVEGALAARDLISAMSTLNAENLDVIVIARGGGSLESLQAFNNEAVVRKLKTLSVPVICGIGHDADVPLAALAADLMVSTPTAATAVLNKPWERIRKEIEICESSICAHFERMYAEKKRDIDNGVHVLTSGVNRILAFFERMSSGIDIGLLRLDAHIRQTRELLGKRAELLVSHCDRALSRAVSRVEHAEKSLNAMNPERPLAQGYSILFRAGKVVRSVADVQAGDNVDIAVSDGIIEATTKMTKPAARRRV